MYLRSIFALSLLVSGCVNPINQKTAENYQNWGREAENAGNYQLAEQNYEKSLLNARIGGSPTAGISMAAYNLGRVKRLLCKNKEAESLLLEALELEEQASGENSGLTSMRLFELARLNFGVKEYEAAGKYYDRAISNVRALGIEQSDPIGFAAVLENYANVLTQLGDLEKAEVISDDAVKLRTDNPNEQAGFMPIMYGPGCGAGST